MMTEMGKFYWTKKAEERARALGLEERKAGTLAMFGGRPLMNGMTATAWKKKGYVVEA